MAAKKTLFERVVESPATALDATVETSVRTVNSVRHNPMMQRPARFWHSLGPGLTTGASDDDPSGIATYSQTGAQYGFRLLWLAGFTFPFMAVVQEMCARIGLVTGRGLAGNIRRHFPRWVLYLCTGLLFLANSFNIGADLGAMAQAAQLLVPGLSFALLIAFFAVTSLLLQIYSAYKKYAQYLKWLALILFAYVFAALSVPTIHWSEVWKAAIVPHFTNQRDLMLLVCAILGTTISPYLFFWQTSQEVEESILEGKTTIVQRQAEVTQGDIHKMRIDVWSGMFLSNVVMFFIIVACGATLWVNGITQITTAAQAAEALRPFAGQSAYLLFALGVIGTGMLSIPVLAGSSSYALSESLGWRNGLYRHLKQARAFYGVIILSVVIGWGLNFSGIDPIRALILAAVANGIVAPVVLVLIVLMGSNHKLMGEHVNSPLATTLGWVITVAMVVAGVGAIVALL